MNKTLRTILIIGAALLGLATGIHHAFFLKDFYQEAQWTQWRIESGIWIGLLLGGLASFLTWFMTEPDCPAGYYGRKK